MKLKEVTVFGTKAILIFFFTKKTLFEQKNY